MSFSYLLTHHMHQRSQASLALTRQLSGQLQPLNDRENIIRQQIDHLPDEKYQDGTPARRESNCLHDELHPIVMQQIRLMKENFASKQALESPFWNTAQLTYNRIFWWLIPLVFGGWLWFMVHGPVHLRQSPNQALQRTAG